MLLILGLSFGLFAAEEYNPMQGIRDLYFEIHSDEMRELVEAKASLNKFDGLYCEVYWTKERFEVLVKANEIGDHLKKLIRDGCQEKAQVLIGFSFDEFLKSFEFKEKKDGLAIYVDASGTKEINELWVKEEPSRLKLIEKRPIGTVYITYNYQNFPWSKGKKVLSNVEHKSFEGIQNIKASTVIEYDKILEDYHLPVKLEVSSSQNLVVKDVGNFERGINETYYFKNFAVNKSKALIWFSKN